MSDNVSLCRILSNLSPTPKNTTIISNSYKATRVFEYTMKLFHIFTFLFTIVIFHETFSSSISYYDKFVKDQNSHRMFFRILDFRRIKKTILCDMDKDTDISLKQSIIDGILHDQSVTIKSTENINKGHKKYTITKDVNIVVITSDFDKILAYKQLESSIFLFKKSTVYIIITRSDDSFKCSNEKFKPEIFNQIQDWMNEFWHTFEIFRVVVVFPFTCPHIYIIYSGKKPSNRTLFDRTITTVNTRDFLRLTPHVIKSSDSLSQGYPLKASIFDRFPTSICTCDKINDYVNWNGKNTDGFCGLDGLVLNDFVNFFGFNITFPKYNECEQFGYLKSEDNTTGGSLGCVIQGKIDVSFNSRFLVQYSDQDYFYIYYVTSDTLCALLKQPDFIPLWLYPNAFHTSSWIFIAALILFLGTVAWVFAKISAKIKDEGSKQFCHHMFHSCTSTLFGFSLDKLSKVRIIRGTCLLCSIVFMTLYQSHISYSFTTVSHFERIKTLSELYRSGVRLQTSSSIKALIKNLQKSNDPDQVHFFVNAKLLARSDIGAVLKEPHIATLVRKADSDLEIMLKYTDSYQRPMLYIVDECFSLYYLSYITRAGFPFTDELIIFMQHLIEAGLPRMYYKWTARTLGVPDNIPTYGVEKREFNQITISDQRIAFYLLFGGYLIAIIAFVLEKLLIFKKNYCVKTTKDTTN